MFLLKASVLGWSEIRLLKLPKSFHFKVLVLKNTTVNVKKAYYFLIY